MGSSLLTTHSSRPSRVWIISAMSDLDLNLYKHRVRWRNEETSNKQTPPLVDTVENFPKNALSTEFEWDLVLCPKFTYISDEITATKSGFFQRKVDELAAMELAAMELAELFQQMEDMFNVINRPKKFDPQEPFEVEDIGLKVNQKPSVPSTFQGIIMNTFVLCMISLLVCDQLLEGWMTTGKTDHTMVTLTQLQQGLGNYGVIRQIHLPLLWFNEAIKQSETPANKENLDTQHGWKDASHDEQNDQETSARDDFKSRIRNEEWLRVNGRVNRRFNNEIKQSENLETEQRKKDASRDKPKDQETFAMDDFQCLCRNEKRPSFYDYSSGNRMVTQAQEPFEVEDIGQKVNHSPSVPSTFQRIIMNTFVLCMISLLECNMMLECWRMTGRTDHTMVTLTQLQQGLGNYGVIRQVCLPLLWFNKAIKQRQTPALESLGNSGVTRLVLLLVLWFHEAIKQSVSPVNTAEIDTKQGRRDVRHDEHTNEEVFDIGDFQSLGKNEGRPSFCSFDMRSIITRNDAMVTSRLQKV